MLLGWDWCAGLLFMLLCLGATGMAASCLQQSVVCRSVLLVTLAALSRRLFSALPPQPHHTTATTSHPKPQPPYHTTGNIEAVVTRKDAKPHARL